MRFVLKRVWIVRIDGGLTCGDGDKSPVWLESAKPIDFYFEDGATIDGVLRDIRESFAASYSKVPGNITFLPGESGWTVVHEHIGQIAYVSTLEYPVAPLNRPTHF